jgi:hypothetical protein
MREAILISWYALVVILIVRDILVYRFRTRIIDGMYLKSCREIDLNIYKESIAQHRRKEFQRVSYHRMVFTFWKPLKSFYDREFLKDLGIR